jgi:hypothetical protein
VEDVLNYRLPPEVQQALTDVPPGFRTVWLGKGAVEPALRALDTLPPRAVVRADLEVAWLLKLFIHRKGAYWAPGSMPRAKSLSLLQELPGLEYLFLFHRDGRLREAALDKLSGPVRSPFFFAMIALRLNDWAVQVRDAAARCANRVFPVTPADVIAPAAMFLLQQRARWGRWRPVDYAPLDIALGRPEIVEMLVTAMCHETRGPMGRILRSALRSPMFDGHLLRLATDARLPSVRAAALQALIDGEARWPSHQEKKWIDKSMGQYRMAWVHAARALDTAVSSEQGVDLAARDRSAAVRRLAVIALLLRGHGLANFDVVAARLFRDKNPALRDRAAFALNMQKGAATSG